MPKYDSLILPHIIFLTQFLEASGTNATPAGRAGDGGGGGSLIIFANHTSCSNFSANFASLLGGAAGALGDGAAGNQPFPLLSKQLRKNKLLGGTGGTPRTARWARCWLFCANCGNCGAFYSTCPER